MANGAIQYGRRIRGRARVSGAGFATKYPEVGAELKEWWIKSRARGEAPHHHG